MHPIEVEELTCAGCKYNSRPPRSAALKFRVWILGSGERMINGSVNQRSAPPLRNFTTSYSYSYTCTEPFSSLELLLQYSNAPNHDCSKRGPNCRMYNVEREKCVRLFS